MGGATRIHAEAKRLHAPGSIWLIRTQNTVAAAADRVANHVLLRRRRQPDDYRR